MTPTQRKSFFIQRWPAACQAQGWNPQDRDLRLRIVGQALGREVLSLNDLDNKGDVDRLFAHLGMLCDDVRATIETDRPDLGAARRLRWKIAELVKVLGAAYVLRICRDRFHAAIDDLDAEQLRQLLITLSARAQAGARRPELAARES